jgi:hypothetical protein
LWEGNTRLPPKVRGTRLYVSANNTTAVPRNFLSGNSVYSDDDPNDCFSNWTLLDVPITDKELSEKNLSKWLSMIPDQQLR